MFPMSAMLNFFTNNFFREESNRHFMPVLVLMPSLWKFSLSPFRAVTWGFGGKKKCSIFKSIFMQTTCQHQSIIKGIPNVLSPWTMPRGFSYLSYNPFFLRPFIFTNKFKLFDFFKKLTLPILLPKLSAIKKINQNCLISPIRPGATS